jgi:hypothetical protein
LAKKKWQAPKNWKPFAGRGDPRNGKGGAREGAGRPSELHRAECRRLVEEHGIRQLFVDVPKGKRVDFYVTLGGKFKKVPASISNRLRAGQVLIEQGHGTKVEHEHTFSPETVKLFEQRLITIFQRHLPKMCPHCKTDLAMPPELATEILTLSRIFERPEEFAGAH